MGEAPLGRPVFVDAPVLRPSLFPGSASSPASSGASSLIVLWGNNNNNNVAEADADEAEEDAAVREAANVGRLVELFLGLGFAEAPPLRPAPPFGVGVFIRFSKKVGNTSLSGGGQTTPSFG